MIHRTGIPLLIVVAISLAHPVRAEKLVDVPNFLEPVKVAATAPTENVSAQPSAAASNDPTREQIGAPGTVQMGPDTIVEPPASADAMPAGIADPYAPQGFSTVDDGQVSIIPKIVSDNTIEADLSKLAKASNVQGPAPAGAGQQPIGLGGNPSNAPIGSLNSPVPSLPDPNRLPREALRDLPSPSEVAVILANDHFYPAKIHLREGQPARLIFTTINKKPGALIIERLKLQRWIAREPQTVINNEVERARWEINREMISNRITEVIWEPRKGSYTFHDALTGARGEIIVE